MFGKKKGVHSCNYVYVNSHNERIKSRWYTHILRVCNCNKDWVDTLVGRWTKENCKSLEGNDIGETK